MTCKAAPSSQLVVPSALILMGLLFVLLAPPLSARTFAEQGTSTSSSTSTSTSTGDEAAGGTGSDPPAETTQQSRVSGQLGDQQSRVSVPPTDFNPIACSILCRYAPPTSQMSFCLSTSYLKQRPSGEFPMLSCTLNVWGKRGGGGSTPVADLGSCIVGDACNKSVSSASSVDTCRACAGFPAGASNGVCYGYCASSSEKQMQLFFTVQGPDGQVVSNDVDAIQQVDPSVTVEMVNDQCYGGPCASDGVVTPTPGATRGGSAGCEPSTSFLLATSLLTALLPFVM